VRKAIRILNRFKVLLYEPFFLKSLFNLHFHSLGHLEFVAFNEWEGLDFNGGAAGER
jgi:hypothetical protein